MRCGCCLFPLRFQQLRLLRAPYMFRVLKNLPKDLGGGGLLAKFSTILHACRLCQKQVWELMAFSMLTAWQTNATDISRRAESQCPATSRALRKQTHLWKLPVWATFLATQAHIAYILHGSTPLMSKSPLRNILVYKYLSYFRMNIRNVSKTVPEIWCWIMASKAVWWCHKLTSSSHYFIISSYYICHYWILACPKNKFCEVTVTLKLKSKAEQPCSHRLHNK